MGKLEIHDIIAKYKAMAQELGKSPTLREMLNSGLSRRQIEYNGGHNKCLELAGLDLNFSPFIGHSVKPRAPKILFFDIETSLMDVVSFGIRDQNIGTDQIIKDWHLLSWSAKWNGSDEIFYEDIRKSYKKKDPDKKILPGIHKLISEADIIVTHNGDSFDVKKLNARFVKFGLPPLSPYRSIDTLKIAKKYFKFTSNKLEYLADYLGVEVKKDRHKNFPGLSLWKACREGIESAYMEMETYNKTDVLVLEHVYNRLAPYDPSIKFSIFHQVDTCSCGGTVFIKDGLTYTASGAYQRYVCKTCSKVFKDKTNLINKDVRKGLLS
jgi:uncharacterized protein YprB with RNaseH-like and TPR domain